MIKRCLITGFVLLLAGCSVLQSQQGSEPVPLAAPMAVIPLLNLSQTPQAGDQAASILSAILRARGVEDLNLYLPEDDGAMTYPNLARQRNAIDEARAGGARYVFTGTVEEWRYKSGLDGEPAVGVTLEVRRAGNNQVIWSGTAARTGWGREGLSVAGHKVMDTLVDAIPFSRQGQ